MSDNFTRMQIHTKDSITRRLMGDPTVILLVARGAEVHSYSPVVRNQIYTYSQLQAGSLLGVRASCVLIKDSYSSRFILAEAMYQLGRLHCDVCFYELK